MTPTIQQAIDYLRSKDRGAPADLLAEQGEDLTLQQAVVTLESADRSVSAGILASWILQQQGTVPPTRKRSNLEKTLIRPGLLVSLKTSLRGGVHYNKQTIAAEQVGAASIAKWETIRTIADAEEHARAVVARGKARASVTRVCCASTFGLLCPESQESALEQAISDAQAIADAHNATANCTRLEVYAITGRVADSDVQAARAIGSEVKELLAQMENAVRLADPKAIRESANKARAVASMLSDDTATRVNAAIGEARSIARKIVASIEESGTVAAGIVDTVRLTAIRDARFAVLDMLGEESALDAQAIAIAPAPAIDLTPDEYYARGLFVADAQPRNLDIGD